MSADKRLLWFRLMVEHTGKQHASVAHDGAARLEDQQALEVLDQRRDGLRQVLGLQRRFVLIGDPEPAPDVEVAEMDSNAGQRSEERRGGKECRSRWWAYQ